MKVANLRYTQRFIAKGEEEASPGSSSAARQGGGGVEEHQGLIVDEKHARRVQHPEVQETGHQLH